MVTAEELAARRAAIARSRDLQALRAHLAERARPLLERTPVIPEHKALLSVDGGVCPDDGAALTFDPWSPAEHRCPRCGRAFSGERHDRHWARYQHLWLAERAAHLAALAALGDDGAAAGVARELLAAYAGRYWRYPNRDNVLGPSRLFFSTYLESLWVLNYLAAAILLRGAGGLDDATAAAVHQVADEAATLIGDFDEGFSNRQTWNNAALTAIAVWFEDEDLARRALEGPTGLVEHLGRGFGRDGMWYEGENYHLFALRGLLTGVGWARLAGLDFCADPRMAERIGAALRAPALSALPDFTFPARKDSRFGVSLAQPMYLEVWEIGLANLGKRETGNGTREQLAGWLAALYRDARSPALEVFESYLHEAPVSPVPFPVSRATLSWWALLEMSPELSGDADAWKPGSVLLDTQGLPILRRDGRYASLESGAYGGGHGHPDRLHLTVHANGVHWLRDPGTGSYVSPELFWYRSTLAHNAPRVDAVSQQPGEAVCEMFDEQGDWAWARGRFGSVTRTLVAGPIYLVDVVELTGQEERVLEVPWHVAGRGEVVTRGRWEPAQLAGDFVTRAERFVPDAPGPLVITHAGDGATLTLHVVLEGDLLRGEGPGLPDRGARAPFYVARGRGRNLRFVTVLEPHRGDARVRAVRARGETVEVDVPAGVEEHHFTGDRWEIHGPGVDISLAGPREHRARFEPIIELDPPAPPKALALRVSAPPPLDGTFAGFDLMAPIELAVEDQYRRSEEPYPGPDELRAVAYAAWDEEALYLAIEVTKPDLCLRPGAAEPLKLDNEPDDVHSDGLQIYVRGDAGDAVGYLVVPDADGRGLRVRPAGGTSAGEGARAVRGEWRRTSEAPGYRVTLAIPWPSGVRHHLGDRVAFDLLVNEMLPGRTRRAGQLVWSGGGGWIWLRGDRQDPRRFGTLELVG